MGSHLIFRLFDFFEDYDPALVEPAKPAKPASEDEEASAPDA